MKYILVFEVQNDGLVIMPSFKLQQNNESLESKAVSEVVLGSIINDGNNIL